LEPDWQDEIVAGTALTRDGVIVDAPTQEAVDRLTASTRRAAG
jgi:hypothetical protein